MKFVDRRQARTLHQNVRDHLSIAPRKPLTQRHIMEVLLEIFSVDKTQIGGHLAPLGFELPIQFFERRLNFVASTGSFICRDQILLKVEEFFLAVREIDRQPLIVLRDLLAEIP